VISFAARRFAWALVTAFIASVIAFAMFWAIPNVDPSYWLGGAEHGTDATRARAVEKYGLDDPLPVQYTRLMGEILSGDVACFYGCGSLRSAFLQSLPVTLSLVAGAALIAIGTGVALAMVCVRHRDQWQDRAVTTAATAAYSVPSLVLAALLWGFLSYKWTIFPQGGTWA
jgi:peptide/nickel transport system permease protein